MIIEQFFDPPVFFNINNIIVSNNIFSYGG